MTVSLFLDMFLFAVFQSYWYNICLDCLSYIQVITLITRPLISWSFSWSWFLCFFNLSVLRFCPAHFVYMKVASSVPLVILSPFSLFALSVSLSQGKPWANYSFLLRVLSCLFVLSVCVFPASFCFASVDLL